MKTFFRILFFFLLVTQICFGQWIQTNGPYGFEVTCFAVSGTNLFVGTSGDGVFHSSNNGTSWISVSSGLPRKHVSALAVCGGKLFAGFDCTGVWVSTNNGTSWAPTSLTDSYNQYYTGCSCSSFGPFVVSGSTLFVGTCGGIWRSQDYGYSWYLLEFPYDLYLVQALAASGANLYAGIWSLNPYSLCNLYKSPDYGGTWTELNRDWTDDYSMSLAVLGTNLFVATSSGVFRSTDDGESWTTTNTGLTDSNITTLTPSAGDLYAGTQSAWVFRSTNEGTSWTAAASGKMSQKVSCIIELGGYLFAGTSGLGVFVTTNHGTSWTQTSVGLPYSNGIALVNCGKNLLANSCMSLSIDSGASWTPLNAGMNVINTASMGPTVIAGTDHGVYITTDDGMSWCEAGLNNSSVPAITVLGTCIFAGNSSGIFLSTNNGVSWENVGLTDTSVSALAVSGTALFAGTTSGGIFRSVNNGTTWIRVDTDSTHPPVISFAVNGANLFAVMKYPKIFPPPKGLPNYVVNQFEQLFGSVDPIEGIYLSTDDGVTWTYTGPFSIKVNSLLANGGYLFAGTDGHGVLLSSNSGASWETMNTGLADTLVSHQLSSMVRVSSLGHTVAEYGDDQFQK